MGDRDRKLRSKREARPGNLSASTRKVGPARLSRTVTRKLLEKRQRASDEARRREESRKVLFVGEQSNSHQDEAFGMDAGAARRLAAMLGVTHAEMVERYDFVNLLSPGKWSVKSARLAGEKVWDFPHRRVVFLGRKVAQACWGESHLPPPLSVVIELAVPAEKMKMVLYFPHPSGRNRVFNDPELREEMSASLRRFVR